MDYITQTRTISRKDGLYNLNLEQTVNMVYTYSRDTGCIMLNTYQVETLAISQKVNYDIYTIRYFVIMWIKR